MKHCFLTLILLLSVHLSVGAQDNWMKGYMAYRQGNYSVARFHLERSIKDENSMGYAESLLSNVYLHYQMYEEAIRMADSALVKLILLEKDGHFLAYSSKGTAADNLQRVAPDTITRNKYIKMAIDNYTRAIETNNDNQILLYRSRLYMRTKRYEEALADCETAIKSNKKNSDAHTMKGEIYAEMHQPTMAIACYNEALKHNSQNTQAMIYRAFEHLKKSKHNLFVNDLLLAINNGELYRPFEILESMQNEPDINKAFYAEIDKRISKDPTTNKEPFIAGMLNLRRNNHYDAIKYFRTAIRRGFKSTDSKIRIARSLLELGCYEQALTEMDTIKNISPFDSQTIFIKAMCYLGTKEYNKAKTEISKYIEINPNDIMGYYMKGNLYDEIGETQKAIANHSIAITLDSTNTYSLLSRAKLYLDLGEKQYAEDDFNKIRKMHIDPTNNNFRCVQYAEFYMGNNERAKECCKQTITHLGDDDSSNYDAACLYSLIGDKDTALDYLQTALQKGYCDFSHIETDSDLDNIRNEQRFIKVVKKYKTKRDKAIAEIK